MQEESAGRNVVNAVIIVSHELNAETSRRPNTWHCQESFVQLAALCISADILVVAVHCLAPQPRPIHVILQLLYSRMLASTFSACSTSAKAAVEKVITANVITCWCGLWNRGWPEGMKGA